MMTKKTMVEHKEYNTVDIVKFICAILVVTIHVPPLGDYDSMAYFNYAIRNYLARIAVPFFFVASGYFLYKKTTLDNFDWVYTKKSVVRLLKMYIIWTILYLPLTYTTIFSRDYGIGVGLLKYLHQFIFCGNYTPLWYISATMFAMLLISFMLKSKINAKIIVTMGAVFYVIGLFGDSWRGFAYPIKDAVPMLWVCIKKVQSIVLVANNGVFFGMLFIGIGMIFAFYNLNIKKKVAFIGLIISMGCLLVEVFGLKILGISADNNMYLSLIPVAIFLFSLASTVQVTWNINYKMLRLISILVFYMHSLLCHAVMWILDKIKPNLSVTPLTFIITLGLSIAFSYMIIKLSEKKNFGWLKNLYS